MALDTIEIARLEIAKIYIAAFNRVPDANGLSNWMNQYTAGLMTYEQIAQDFTNQAEYQAEYPALLTNTEYVAKIYLNVFGRAADAGGLANWANQLQYSATTGIDRGNIMNRMIEVASETGNTDGERLTNQATFGVQSILDEVPTDIATAQLVNITSVDATVTTATAAVAAYAGTITGTTFTLTTGVDTITGTVNNDTITATLDGVGATETLTVLDTIDGGNGVDTLNILNAVAATAALPAGITVSNVETVNVRSADDIGVVAGAEFDVSGFTGVTTLNTTQSVDVAVKAAATTDINVSGATGVIEVLGGKNISVTDSTAAKNITVSAVAATGNAAGVITVTDTNQTTGNIVVDGGTTVTVTATSAATSGNITVGGNKAATGAVVVTQNTTSDGSAAVTAGNVSVTGGSTINIAANLTTTSGATADTNVITAGTYTATGSGTTTAVTITQTAVANDFAGTAATTAATYEKAVMTFGALAAGEAVLVGATGGATGGTDLTFIASKALTAAEVAAAIANLANVDTQASGGITTNGYFTGALDTGWTSAAVSGSTVTFTATTTGDKVNLEVYTDANGAGAADNAAAADATFAAVTTAGAAAVGGTAANDITATYGAVVVDDNATEAITTITLNGFDGATLGGGGSLDALATLNLSNGAGATALTSTVTTLAATLNGMAAASAMDISTAAAVATLNLTTTGSASDVDFTAVDTTTVNITAGANLDVSGGTFVAATSITVAGAGNVTLGDVSAVVATLSASTATGAISATVDGTKATVTTGSGADSITVDTATQTKAINLGAGDDTLTYSTATMGVPTGATAGGDGTDTIKMTFASAQSLDANTNFKTAISGFERLTISDQAIMAADADITIDLEALGFNYVTLAMGTDDTEATNPNKLILSNMASGGTLVMNATQALTSAQASTQVNIKDAATGTADSLNIVISAEATVNAKTVLANNVETLNITATDVYLDNAGVDTNNATHVLVASGDKYTSVVVTGDDLNLDTNSTVLTSVNASAMTGGITYTADGAAAGTTVTGGLGADTLVASGSSDTLLGGTGNDTLTGANLTTLTGGAGNDKFIVNIPTNVNSYSTITDLSSGDVIQLTATESFVASAITLAPTAVFQDFANAAVNQLAIDNKDAAWFQFGTNTYIVINDDQADAIDADFENGADAIIQITGLVNLGTGASYNLTNGTLEIA